MVPAAVVVLPSCRDPNRKVDRKPCRLRDGSARRGLSGTEDAGRRGPRRHLGRGSRLERVGTDGNFFELAALAAGDAGDLAPARRPGRRAALRTLFERPTVASWRPWSRRPARRHGRGGPSPGARPRGRDLPSPSPRSASGSSTRSTRGRPPSTCPARSGSSAGWTPRRSPRRSAPCRPPRGLRTVFRAVDGVPRPHILPADGVAVFQSSISPCAGGRAPRGASGSPPGTRAPLRPGPRPAARRGAPPPEPERHHLLVVLHHVICDGLVLHLLCASSRALRGLRGAAPVAPGRAARAVRRLRGLAARAGHRDAAGGARLVAECPGGSGRRDIADIAARPAHRPSPATGPDLSRRACRARPDPRARRAAEPVRPRPRRHALHDAPRRDPGPAAPPQRPGRHPGRRAGGRPPRRGDRGADRLLPEHPGPAHRPRGRPGFRVLVERVLEVTWGPIRTRTSLRAVLAVLPLERDLSRTPLFR